ncbi:MAG: hypothetical protein RLW87_04030 [Alphaproteobacteria bacterium]
MRALIIAVWVVMVGVTGYALFHITFQVEALEGQLAELNRQIREEQERIHNLKAEWSYNSRPDWIETLGEEYMPDMNRMHPAQVLRIQDIPFRRPENEGLPASLETPATTPKAPAEAVPATLMRTSQ